VPILKAAIKGRTEDGLKKAIDGASAIWFEIKLLKDARLILKGLEREKEIHVEIKTLVNKDPDDNYNEYEKIINEMEMIQRHDSGAFSDPTSLKVRKLFKSVEARRDVEYDLKDGIRTFNKVQLQDAIKRLTGLKSEYGNFAPALEKEAQSIIQSIDEEEN
jgi:hypothetical protein